MRVQQLHKVELDSTREIAGRAAYLHVFPRGAIIKDILLYKPSQIDRNITIWFFKNIEIPLLLSKDVLITNKLYRVNLEVSGMIDFLVSAKDIKLVIFYV